MPDNVLALAQRFKKSLEENDLAALSRIIRAYTDIHKRIDGETKLLIAEIEDKRDAGQPVTENSIRRLERYRRTMAEVEAELKRYTQFMAVELSGLGKDMIGRGLDESKALVTAPHPELRGVFRDLAPEAVEQMLGFLDPKGPLFKRLELLPRYVAEMYSRKLLENLALGRNPRIAAREITNALGVGLSESLRMARTVQLYSYREATRANYVANSDIVRGWQWMATLGSDRTCLSCIAMHGSIHPLSEPLEDHHQGRCVAVPFTILDRNAPIAQTGIDWILAMPDGEQRRLLRGYYEPWKSGAFDLSALSRRGEDEVWGGMRTVPPIKDLAGANA